MLFCQFFFYNNKIINYIIIGGEKGTKMYIFFSATCFNRRICLMEIEMKGTKELDCWGVDFISQNTNNNNVKMFEKTFLFCIYFNILFYIRLI